MALAVPLIVKIASVPMQTAPLEVNEVIAGVGFMVTVAEFVNGDVQLPLSILVSLIVVFVIAPKTVAVP